MGIGFVPSDNVPQSSMQSIFRTHLGESGYHLFPLWAIPWEKADHIFRIWLFLAQKNQLCQPPWVYMYDRLVYSLINYYPKEWLSCSALKAVPFLPAITTFWYCGVLCDFGLVWSDENLNLPGRPLRWPGSKTEPWALDACQYPHSTMDDTAYDGRKWAQSARCKESKAGHNVQPKLILPLIHIFRVPRYHCIDICK